MSQVINQHWYIVINWTQSWDSDSINFFIHVFLFFLPQYSMWDDTVPLDIMSVSFSLKLFLSLFLSEIYSFQEYRTKFLSWPSIGFICFFFFLHIKKLGIMVLRKKILQRWNAMFITWYLNHIKWICTLEYIIWARKLLPIFFYTVKLFFPLTYLSDPHHWVHYTWDTKLHLL